MISEIINIAFSGFWPFVGMAILLNGAGYFIWKIIVGVWAEFMKMLMVWKHGWPPQGQNGQIRLTDKFETEEKAAEAKLCCE